MLRRTHRLGCLPPIALATLAACSGDDLASPPGGSIALGSVSVAANPTNALAASVTVLGQGDSALVLYSAVGGPADSTAAVAVADGKAVIPVLGLRTGVSYRGVVELRGHAPGARLRSGEISFAGGELPEPLRHVTVTTTGAGTAGLTLTALPLGGTTLAALAFDSSGAIRWYRAFPDPRVGGELKQQANGRLTLYLGASFGSQPVPGGYVEFSPAGDSIRSWAAPDPLYTDNHELVITGSGAGERIHLFGYDHRLTDLSGIGGPVAAQLAGHHVLRLRPDGSAEFDWSAWDHLRVADWIEPPAPGPVDPDEPDFDHPNSLAFDLDSNYIVSWRNLGEVMKLDARTGGIIWRLGGVHNQFTFVDDPFGGFSAQHYAHILPDGHLLLYDNGTRHQPPQTRVLEYALDIPARTATLVWSFRHTPPIYTPFVGSVQRLRSGNTTIGYGTAGHITEVTPGGTVVWEADLRVDGQPAFAYRLVRIASLYRAEAP